MIDIGIQISISERSSGWAINYPGPQNLSSVEVVGNLTMCNTNVFLIAVAFTVGLWRILLIFGPHSNAKMSFNQGHRHKSISNFLLLTFIKGSLETILSH